MAHNDIIKEVLKIQLDGVDVFADHVSGTKFTDFVSPEHYLSAYIPTQAYFTPKPTLPNSGWHIPDIVFRKSDLLYVIEVVDDNDTTTSIARKIETIISNSKQFKIVGATIISEGRSDIYSGKLGEWKKLQSTFNNIFHCVNNHDDYIANLKTLFAQKPYNQNYKNIDWSRIKEITISVKDWQNVLQDDILSCYGNGKSLVA